MAVTDPHSGQPESKQVAVAIAAWLPTAWKVNSFSRQPVPIPASLHWRRRAAQNAAIFLSPGISALAGG